MMATENQRIAAQIYTIWLMSKMKNGTAMDHDTVYIEDSFIAQVILKRMEAFKVPIRIPDPLIALIELTTGSNPGMSLIMLHEIMRNIPDLKSNHEILPEDFIRVYTNEFPDVRLPKWNEHFTNIWDQQKCEGSNQVDGPKYWLDLFKEGV